MPAAARHGLTTLIVPVRPTLKHRYPLTPMERYVEWKQSDGSPFDPWIRVHWRLGAETLRIAAQSMVVTGTLAPREAAGALQPRHGGQEVGRGAAVCQVAGSGEGVSDG